MLSCLFFGFRTPTHDIRPPSNTIFLQTLYPKINFKAKYSFIQFSRAIDMYLETSYSKFDADTEKLNLKGRLALFEFLKKKLYNSIKDDRERIYQLDLIHEALFFPVRSEAGDFISS